MKKTKTFKLGISLALVFSLAINSLAFASDLPQTEEQVTEQTQTGPQIIGEDTSRRSEYEKNFTCDDGSMIAAVYHDQVHERDENGTWQEIDNTLALTDDRIQNKAQFRTSFAPQAAGDGPIASLENDGKQLSWSLTATAGMTEQAAAELTQNGMKAALSPAQAARLEESDNPLLEYAPALSSNPRLCEAVMTALEPVVEQQAAAKRLYAFTPNPQAKAQIQNDLLEAEAAPAAKTNDEWMTVSKSTSSVLYEDALGEGIDVKYTVFPNRTKEDIILGQKGDFYSYTMRVDAAGMTAVLKEDNSVDFKDENDEAVFTIKTPYMYDAADADSYDIAVSLEQVDGKYEITYTPDAAWLADEARVYPVVIDPVTSTSRATSNVEDTYIAEGSTTNYSGADRMYIGIRNGKKHRALFKIKSLGTSVPKAIEITSATLTVLLYNGTSTYKPFNLDANTASWSPSSVNWSNRPATTPMHLNVARESDNRVIFQSAALKEMIARHHAGTIANYGFTVVQKGESMTNPDYNSIYSSENTTRTACPIIWFGYTEATNVTPGTYYIRNKNSGKYLDVTNGGGNGTDVIQYRFGGGANQQWKIQRVNDTNYYKLIPQHNTSQALHVRGSVPDRGAQMQIRTGTSSYAEHFSFIKLSDGSYKILTRMTGGERVVIVKSGLKDDGTKVTQNNYNATANEEWYLVPATHSSAEQLDMSIYATNRSGLAPVTDLGGHAFLSFTNKTSQPIQVGPICLLPNRIMTICKWKETNIHGGVWFNRDTAIKDSDLIKYVYLTTSINGNDLAWIEDYIDTHDSYNILNNNCTDFAGEIWNHLTGMNLNYLNPNHLYYSTPVALYQSIIKYNYKTNRVFALADDIGYYNENGQFIKQSIDKELN